MMEPTVLVTLTATSRSSQRYSLMNMIAPSGITRKPIHLTRFWRLRIISLCCGGLAAFASSVRRET